MIHLHTYSSDPTIQPEGPIGGDGIVTMCFPFRWNAAGNPMFSPFATQKSIAHFAYWNWTSFDAQIQYTVQDEPQYSKDFNFVVNRQFLDAEILPIKEQIALYSSGQEWTGSQIIEDGSNEFAASLELKMFQEQIVGNDLNTAIRVPAMYVTSDGGLWQPSFTCAATVAIAAGAEFNITFTSFISPDDTTEYEVLFAGFLNSAQFGTFGMHAHSELSGSPLASANLSLRPRSESFINWNS